MLYCNGKEFLAESLLVLSLPLLLLLLLPLPLLLPLLLPLSLLLLLLPLPPPLPLLLPLQTTRAFSFPRDGSFVGAS